MKKTARGAFITFYGVNNIGKSTHAKIVCERLNAMGLKAKYLKYPVYEIEPSGVYINKILRDPAAPKVSAEELQMWFAINRFQFQSELSALLSAGTIVIAEDYTGTGIAWGMARGADEDWLTTVNSYLLKEDLAVYFSGARKLSAREDGHLHEKDDVLTEKAKLAHEHLGKKYGWKNLQVQSDPQETARLLWNIIDGFVRERYDF